jgi:CubicO group peptidase (beta-lactamase class C family)
MPLTQVSEPTASMLEAVPVHGFVADGFAPVAEQFARNFTELGDVGAAFSVVRHGETVVDLWAGTSAPGRAWAEDTLQVIFSGTKGLTATCMLMLVDRGQLDLEKPVAHYWPEFAANGKERLLVRDIVSHHSGLPGITQGALAIDDLADDQAMEARLAAQPLSPDPNAYRCYHALTIGWLCGGVLRRIDGRSLGRFFADEVAGPLGLDIWIGLPEAQEPRVGTLQLASDWAPWDADLTAEQKADPTRRSIWANPPLFPTDGLAWNTRPYHACEMPGGGGIATARSMARHYACLANGGELDGVRLMRPETIAAGRRELSRFMDPFIAEPMAFGTAYALQTEQGRFGPPADAFGHSGAGGSIHCAWPSQGLGLSYVMNEMRADPEVRRTHGMLEALYSVVAG